MPIILNGTNGQIIFYSTDGKIIEKGVNKTATPTITFLGVSGTRLDWRVTNNDTEDARIDTVCQGISYFRNGVLSGSDWYFSQDQGVLMYPIYITATATATGKDVSNETSYYQE